MIRYLIAAALFCGCSTHVLAKDQAKKDADREKPLAGPWLGDKNAQASPLPVAPPAPAPATTPAATTTTQAVSTPVGAIVAQPVVVAAPAATNESAEGIIYLPANTAVTVTPNNELTSKTLRKGDSFTVSVVYDVLMNNYIVIPRGSRGQGTVTWRTGKGAFGKSAKMDVSFNWIDVGGRRVAVEGQRRLEGGGNSAAAIGAVVASAYSAGS